MIEIKNVTKTYNGEKKAVDDISFTVMMEKYLHS